MKKSRAPQKDIRVETKEQEEDYEKNLKKLWTIIKKADPEKRRKIVDNLDKKTITALRTYNNPYKKPIIEGERNRYLAFNVINLTEKYSQRFSMTSLVAFEYRMLDEYDPPDLDKYVSENDPQFANLYNQQVKELILTKPENDLVEELNALKETIESMKPLMSHATPEEQKTFRQKIKASFIGRSKLFKYRVYLLKEDHKDLKTKQEPIERDIKNLHVDIKNLETTIDILKVKLEKRKQIEETRIKDMETVRERMAEKKNTTTTLDIVDDLEEEEEEAKIEEVAKEVAELKVTNDIKVKRPDEVLTITEAHERTVESFEQELENKLKLMVILKEKLEQKTATNDEYIKSMNNLNDKIGEWLEKFKNLKEEYTQKMTSKKGPSMSKKSKKKSEGHPLDDVEIDKYEPTEKELDDIADNVKKTLKIEKTAEEYREEIQNIIQAFMDKYFCYNPDKHVRCAYKPNYEDPTRTPLTDEEKEIERSVIPPDDTFFRWNRYIENNYESLRQATDDIYCEKSDFEFDIVPLEVFEGETKEDAEEKFNQFKRKYADEFESDIFSAKFAQHNLLSPWYQNREVRDFYTEKTEIIKRILDQHKEDSRMGQKLMKERANEKKKEDIKKLGPDPKSHKQFLEAHPPKELERHGAVHVDEIDTSNIIKEKSIPRDRKDLKDDELEVGVHVVKPRVSTNGKRRVRGFAEQWKFHIKSEELKEGQAQLQSPAEFQKKLIAQEAQI